MNTVKLALLPSHGDYVAGPDDPLRFYYLPFFGKRYRRRVELCLAALPPGQRVLEVGFGSGVCFPNLHQMFEHVHGLDLTADCGAVCASFRARGIAVHLLNGSVTDMPYKNEQFDAVLLISILEHLPLPALDQAMGEIRRILRPGGTMVYGVPVDRFLMRVAFRMLGCDISRHHLCTQRDVFHAARQRFTHKDTQTMFAAGRLLGPIYEVRSFIRPDGSA